MSTTVIRKPSSRSLERRSASSAGMPPPPARRPPLRSHWTWLVLGLLLGFAVPFVLADRLEVDRDLYYGLYAATVGAFLGSWVRVTRMPLRRTLTRRWPAGLALGALGAGALALMVVRTDDPSPRPEGFELLGAVAWRGVVYGVTDGLFLSVFPVLAVFAAFAASRLRRSLLGTIGVGAVALLAAFAMTAAYHLGYSDFRSAKLAKPIAGTPMWSAPTLLTLSPLGAPIAHAGLHVAAVLHSYETDTFLPPHAGAAAEPAAAVPAERAVTVYFMRGDVLAPVERMTAATPAIATAAVRELLAGPTAAERATGIVSTLPTGTRLLGLDVADGTATVDVTGPFAGGGGSLSIAGRLGELVYTLTAVAGVERAELRIDGETVSVFGAEGLVLEQPLDRATFAAAAEDSLLRSIVPRVLVERPAQGAPYASPLRVAGTAAAPFTLTVVDWDGRIVAEEEVTPRAGGAFDVVIRFEQGLYPRGVLIVAAGGEAVAEVPLGR